MLAHLMMVAERRRSRFRAATTGALMTSRFAGGLGVALVQSSSGWWRRRHQRWHSTYESPLAVRRAVAGTAAGYRRRRAAALPRRGAAAAWHPAVLSASMIQGWQREMLYESRPEYEMHDWLQARSLDRYNREMKNGAKSINTAHAGAGVSASQRTPKVDRQMNKTGEKLWT